MAVIPLTASRRESLGKGGARKSRKAGQIPGVLYGHGETPVAVAVAARDFDVALREHKGGNPIVSLAVNGSEYTALIRAVQYDPLTQGILHLDFQHISLTEQIEVKVAIRLTGLPVGVKDGGGILEPILREVEVRCLPTAIPASIEVDVSHLNIGDSIHLRDLTVPNVVILTDPDSTLATVVPPTVMEEKPAEEVAVAAEAAPTEPEVISKGKKEEGEEAPEAKEKEKGKEKEK
ncbi:MAG TPA: 50S ribosomal protein L25 [Candidatus Sulfotelmatobacter sp.]|nr:50S ribosomal protein L25 [Candidatus Sulfotelmatobacter sp.]